MLSEKEFNQLKIQISNTNLSVKEQIHVIGELRKITNFRNKTSAVKEYLSLET